MQKNKMNGIIQIQDMEEILAELGDSLMMSLDFGIGNQTILISMLQNGQMIQKILLL